MFKEYDRECNECNRMMAIAYGTIDRTGLNSDATTRNKGRKNQDT